MKRSTILLFALLLHLGACGHEAADEPPDLRLDPLVIEKLAAGQLACEREVSGSASLAAADDALARHYGELETTAAQASEFPLSLSVSTESETLRLNFHDELTFGYDSTAGAISLQISTLPDVAVTDYALGWKMAVFELRVRAPVEMSVNWSYSMAVAYFSPRTAPDDIRAGVDAPVVDYKCVGLSSKFSYREYPGYFDEGMNHHYEYETKGERYSLQVGAGKTVRSATTCIGPECTTSKGKNWADYQKRLGEQGVFQNNDFRVPFVSDRVKSTFALLESKQHELGR